jgi:hypothetical protein
MNKGRSAGRPVYGRSAWNRIRYVFLCFGTLACLLIAAATTSPLMAGTTEPNQLLQRPYPDWILTEENFKSNLIPDNTAESWFHSSGTGLNVLELEQAPFTAASGSLKKRKPAIEASSEISAPEPASTQVMVVVMGLLLCGWKLERRRRLRLAKRTEG